MKFGASQETQAVDAVELVRQLSHELRQPLGTIESIAYYLKLVLPPADSRSLQHLDKIQLLVDQINGMLTDAVHYLSPLPLQPRSLDLHELITAAATEANADGAINVRLELTSEPALISLDVAQVQHLFRSLLTVFRQLGGCSDVVIHTSRENSEIVVEVRAPGIVFQPEWLEALFQPFSPSLPLGSGLALAGAKRIVESHGGRISAKSETGLGTSLRSTFPLAG